MFTAAQKNLPNPSWICLKCPHNRWALIKASLLRYLLFPLLGPAPVDFATAGNGEGSRDLNNSSMPLLQNCDCQWAHPQHQQALGLAALCLPSVRLGNRLIKQSSCCCPSCTLLVSLDTYSSDTAHTFLHGAALESPSRAAGSRKQLRQLWWPRAGGPNAWDRSTATCSFKTRFC